jgi:pimeloyl-ACP methyl ester carboxylesterase
MVSAVAEPERGPSLFDGMTAAAWNVAVERFNALPKDGRMLDLRGKMRHIQAPTLIVAGARDPIVPLALAEAMRSEIEKSELVVFERSGHFPMLEEPEKFRVVLEEFLERD